MGAGLVWIWRRKGKFGVITTSEYVQRSADKNNASAPNGAGYVAVATFCLFVSGLTGLAYEICWIRKASLVFGSATFALSTVLAVFFGGMAIGCFLFGRYSQRTNHPLKVYAVLEISIGLLGIASPLAFASADAIYGWLYPIVLDHVVLLSLTRFLFVALILLPPTLLMGGTLPLFCRQLVQSEGRISRSVGWLYGLNTLGAAVGCAICGFWMIPTIGVNRTIYLCGILNIAVGLVVWRVPLVVGIKPVIDKAIKIMNQEMAQSGLCHYARIVSALFFACGFVALGHEVLWARYLSLLTHNTVHTYTLTLAVVLTGIVLGSVIMAGLCDRLRRRAMVFGAVQVANGLTVMAALMLPAEWWQSRRDPANATGQVWMVLVVLLLPAVLSGMSYPLAIRMVVSDPQQAGGGVGRMTSLNTIGGICGALALGFIVLPLAGLQKAIWLTTGMSLLIGFIAWGWLERVTDVWLRIMLIVVSTLAWLAIPWVMETRLPEDFLAERSKLVDFREGMSAFVAVVRKDDRLRLEIDRLWQGSKQKNHQIMAAHVPMLLHKRPSSALVVGLGPGQTASRFLMYPSMQRLDCVEIEGQLLPLVRQHFDATWMEDHRVHTIIEDGRNYLTHIDVNYDVISIEVGQTFRPGIASFYTTEFYQHARARLRPDGILSQFVPLSFFTTDEFCAVIKTFLEVFPTSVLWYNMSECLLIGSVSDELKLSPDRLSILSQNEQLHEDLKYAHWGGPAQWLNQPDFFLAGFLMGPTGLANMVVDASSYHDDRPYLEYTTNIYGSGAEQSIVAMIRLHLEPVEMVLSSPEGTQFDHDIESICLQNLDDIVADTYKGKVDNLLTQKRYEEAVIVCREALRWNTYSVDINNGLGVAIQSQEKYEEAQLSFRRALEIAPDSVLAHHNMGFTLMVQRKFEAAVEHLRRAVKLAPDYAEAHFHLAKALRLWGKPVEAIKSYRAALQANPEYATAHNGLGIVLALQGDLEGAFPNLLKAVKIDPDNADVHNNLGLAYQLRGDLAYAIKHFKQAFRLKDDFAKAHLNLASLLLSTGQASEAADHFRVAVRINPDWVPPHHGLAWLLATHPDYRIRNTAEAVRHAERAVELSKNQSSAVLDTLAAAYATADRFEEAIRVAQEAIEVAITHEKEEQASKIRGRLELYQQGKAHREPISVK